MDFKIKTKNWLKAILILIVSLLCGFILTPIPVHANEDSYTAWARSYVDSLGYSAAGGSD